MLGLQVRRIVRRKTLMHEVRDVLVSSVQGADPLCSRLTRLSMKLPSISVSSEIVVIIRSIFKIVQQHLFQYYFFTLTQSRHICPGPELSLDY